MFNSTESALDEAMNGILTADPGRCERLETEYGYGIYRRNLKENCVRVILNGGGGIGPMWAGCAAEGLSDGIVHGEFDSAPNAYTIYEMAKKMIIHEVYVALALTYEKEEGKVLAYEITENLLTMMGEEQLLLSIHNSMNTVF